MKTHIKIYIIAVLSAIGAFNSFELQAQPVDNNGERIVGKVVDAETGEPLVSATVYVEETEQGAATDLEGNFTIDDIERGSYTLRVSYVAYATKVISNVQIESGETLRLDIDLQKATSEMDEVFVSARSMRNNEASLLAQRQKAIGVSNAISAEYMSRSGSSNAADAMEKVSGASVVDGKYIYVRGLGDRYMNTSLNGVSVPSSEPDRNAVSFDLFPSALLDNITTTKSFTPDMPGNFSGGSVDIVTKDYPDQFEFSISTSSGYKSSIGTSGSMLHYEGGRTGFFGTGNSRLEIPTSIRSSEDVPQFSTALSNKEEAMQLDMITKSFSSVMAPRQIDAPFNNSFSASLGSRFNLFDMPVGFVGAFSQSRDFSGYSSGTSSRFQLTSNAETTDELSSDFILNDDFGKEEVLWGGLFNVSIKPHDLHEIKFNTMINRNVESSARELAGSFTRDLPEDAIFETRVLRYTERTLNSYQLKGNHQLFGANSGVRFEWDASISDTEQDEPDLRFFSNDVTIRQRSDGTVDSTYQISPSIYPRPTRYFRNLMEENRSLNGSFTIPFDDLTGTRTRLKLGGSLSEKERSFKENEFQFAQDRIEYSGDPNEFFAPENLGIDENRSNDVINRFRNYVIDNTQRRNSYDGEQSVNAAFVMLDITLFDRFRISGGVRHESTKIDVVSGDPGISPGSIDENDLLPSFNLTYEINNRMNARFSFGKTLARPTFREMAPFSAFDFVNSNIVVGNPALKRSLIENYDLRWEWFVRPGELLAVSLFYKDFSNPIEKVFNPIAAASNPEIQFRNVEQASVLGVEFEFRKRLDQLSSALQFFDVGFNTTIVRSEVSIADDELQLIQALNPSAGSTRELQGQSPYVLNADLTYSNPNTGTVISTFYNTLGKRMTEVSVGGTPNVFEYPRNQIDFVAEQQFLSGFTAKFSIKNLLNENFRKGHEFKGNDFFIQEHEIGRSVSLGISYKFN